MDKDDKTISLASPQASSIDLRVGQLLEGRYKILCELGRGGMGVVLEVENVFIHKKFAMKLIDMHSSAPSAVQRFQREAQLLTILEHPNIVKATDFGVINDTTPFVLMELVKGQTLSQCLRQRGNLSEKEALEIFLPVARAMDYAHQAGVVHRDLKPGNIMLVKTSDNIYIPKILDFGIASYTESAAEALTRTGEVIGTPLYMSPEQISSRAVSTKSDVYSLGCVLFEALAGTPPLIGRTSLETMMMHSSQTPPSLKEASVGGSFSRACEETLVTMLAKEPEQRPSFSQLVETLQNNFVLKVNDSQIRKSSEPSATHGKLPVALVAILLSLAVVLAISVGATSYCLSHQKQSEARPQVSTAELSSGRANLRDQKAVSTAGGEDLHDSQKLSDEGDISPLLSIASLQPSTDELKQTAALDCEVGPNGFSFDFSNLSKHVGKLIWQKNGELKVEKTDHPVLVPKGVNLWFRPGFATFKDPVSIRRLESAKLHGIFFESHGDNALQSALKVRPTVVSDCLANLPRTVKAIAIEDVTLVDADVIELFEKAQTLEYLYLRQTNIAEFDLRKRVKSLENLKVLDIDYSPHGALLEKVASGAGRNKLTALGLERFPITLEDCREIRKLKQLTFLNLIDCFTQKFKIADALRSIGPMQNLTGLALPAEVIDQDAASEIIKIKKLKKLFVVNNRNFKTEIKDFIKRNLPGCQIEPTVNPNAGLDPFQS